MTAAKTQPTKVSVAGFITSIDNDRRRGDAETALTIYRAVTGLAAVMRESSIVGFGTHDYEYASPRRFEKIVARD